MLDERILLLEEKVVALLSELKRLRQENSTQKSDIQSLTAQANRIPGLEEDIALHKMSVEELTEKANRIPELEEIIATLTEALAVSCPLRSPAGSEPKPLLSATSAAANAAKSPGTRFIEKVGTTVFVWNVV